MSLIWATPKNQADRSNNGREGVVEAEVRTLETTWAEESESKGGASLVYSKSKVS